MSHRRSAVNTSRLLPPSTGHIVKNNSIKINEGKGELFKNIKINNFINCASTSQFIFNTDKLLERKTFEYQSHRVHCEILKV